MNKLTKLYLDDLIDIDYYKQEYNDLKLRIEKANEQNTLPAIDNKKIQKIENLLKGDFMDLYKSLDNLEKRNLWATIIDYAIVIDKDNIKIAVY